MIGIILHLCYKGQASKGNRWEGITAAYKYKCYKKGPILPINIPIFKCSSDAQGHTCAIFDAQRLHTIARKPSMWVSTNMPLK